MVHGDDGTTLYMMHEGVDGKGRHTLGLASSTDGGRSWSKHGQAFAGRDEPEAWDSRNIGTPWLCRVPSAEPLWRPPMQPDAG